MLTYINRGKDNALFYIRKSFYIRIILNYDFPTIYLLFDHAFPPAV